MCSTQKPLTSRSHQIVKHLWITFTFYFFFFFFCANRLHSHCFRPREKEPRGTNAPRKLGVDFYGVECEAITRFKRFSAICPVGTRFAPTERESSVDKWWFDYSLRTPSLPTELETPIPSTKCQKKTMLVAWKGKFLPCVYVLSPYTPVCMYTRLLVIVRWWKWPACFRHRWSRCLAVHVLQVLLIERGNTVHPLCYTMLIDDIDPNRFGAKQLRATIFSEWVLSGVV